MSVFSNSTRSGLHPTHTIFFLSEVFSFYHIQQIPRMWISIKQSVLSRVNSDILQICYIGKTSGRTNFARFKMVLYLAPDVRHSIIIFLLLSSLCRLTATDVTPLKMTERTWIFQKPNNWTMQSHANVLLGTICAKYLNWNWVILYKKTHFIRVS